MIKGYKAFKSDMTCRGMKFQVGKIYTHKGNIELCKEGFHYCENPFDVYNYYDKSSDTLIGEIQDLGIPVKEGDKSCTNKFKLVRMLTDKERIDLWINRTNSGNRNSGDGNSGDGNSGYGNSGYGNSGYGNSGNRNSGDWNSGDGNSGYFNTEVPLYFFNKPTTMKYTKELENKLRSLNVKPILEYIGSNNMTDTEKKEHPYHITTGGFLRRTDRHDWRYLTEQDKEFIKSLPGFDNDVFKVISNGVSLEPEFVEVTINGVKKSINITKAKELGLID